MVIFLFGLNCPRSWDDVPHCRIARVTALLWFPIRAPKGKSMLMPATNEVLAGPHPACRIFSNSCQCGSSGGSSSWYDDLCHLVDIELPQSRECIVPNKREVLQPLVPGFTSDGSNGFQLAPIGLVSPK